MKRVVPAVAALATALLASTSTAAPEAPRVQSLEYVGGGVTTGPDRVVVVRAGNNIGAVVFRGGPERFVSIEIQDTHGLTVAGVVTQRDDDEGTPICGGTEKPLRVRPFENVTVFLLAGACGAGGVSVPTTGTVTATFTRR